MKLTPTAYLLGALLIGANPTFADVPAATVTQTFNTSSHTLSAPAKGDIGGKGTVLGDGQYLKTGKTSLTEMELANKTIARLGPNTSFAYSAAKHEADLQSGTVLFSKPKDGEKWTIKASGVTATITGTTGFVEKEGATVMIGVIEGTVHLMVGNSAAVLPAGKMLACMPGSNPQIVGFDVPNFVKTSAFFHSFSQPLPNEKYIEKEIAQYNDLVSRGFIAPANVTPGSATAQGSVASNEIGGRNAAGNSLHPTVLPGTSVASTAGVSSSAGYSGTTSASGATLSLGNPGSSSGIAFSNGISFASGDSTVATGTGTGTATGANSWAGGAVVNTGTLAANGNGTLVLNSGASSSGVLNITTVNGGTLAGGTSVGGTLGGGTITSIGSGTLHLTGGTGFTVTGGTLLNGTLTPGATIVNNTGNPITVGGITVPAHGSATVPSSH